MPSPTRRTSFVIGNLANPAGFTRFMADYRPTSAVVNDEPKRAAELYDATEGQTMIVHRLVTVNDGAYWQKSKAAYMKPTDYCDYLIRAIPDKHIWKYVLNEPLAKGEAEIAERNNWIIDVADELALRGHHGILGNIGPATWEMDEVERGYYDKLLIAYSKFSAAGVHHGGWHYYTLGYLPFGTGLVPWEWLNDRAKLQPIMWPKKSDLPFTRTKDGKLPPYWHVGRTSWFDIRSQEIGLVPHKKLITECWWDRLGDITRLPNNPYNQWSARFGYGPYKMMRGPRTYEGVWGWMWPQWSFAQAVYEQAMWAEDVLPDTYIGFDMFKLVNGDEWDRDYGFNLEPVTQLFDLLKTRRPPVENVPAEFDDYREAVLVLPSNLSEVNIRSKPGTDSAAAVLSKAKAGSTLRYSPKSLKYHADSRLFWVAVKQYGITGWLALQGANPKMEDQFKPIPVPEPTPAPVPGPQPEAKGIPNWKSLFDERQLKEIAFNRVYDTDAFRQGTEGHNMRLILSLMAKILDGEITP